MREEHSFELQFKDWKRAGYGNKEISPRQETEVKRAFMGGIFEGLNFLISHMDNPNIEVEVNNAYKFLKAFHENEVAINNKSPFGKKYY